MNWTEILRRCYDLERVLYTGHARREMREEQFGPVSDQEVWEAICNGEVIEEYPDDTPYPSVLISGATSGGRPIHIVCSYSSGEDMAFIITVYQPDPAKWIDYRRRKR